MNKYCVYCHTNKIDGKKYVGITCQNPESRWRNGNGYKNNRYFFRAIKKFGWHNFQHEILYTNLSKDDAENIEIKLIKEYGTTMPSKGYNIEKGGNGTEKFTEEIKAKISNALIGHKCSDETKDKISKSKTGKPSPKKGMKMTAEQRKKNSESHKGIRPWNTGRPWTREEKAKCNGKQVLCVDTGIIYLTAHEAARILSVEFSSICKCCRGVQKTCGGFHWAYVDVEPTNG